MTATTTQNDLRPGQTLEGFDIEQITALPDLRATAIRATHRKSGARVLHLYSPTDTENCFAVTFPTPPPDDAGVPHILEHAVLGGSRKFPVREPFFEMIKMSMATFINAMTAQAYTVYPVSSNVKKDFYNLVEVYLDAVFHPELTNDTFRREGHHLTLENNADLSSPLKISGIVYNEMKGASSTPERVMYEAIGRGLYPDTPNGRNSGGDPERIPDLSYEDFLRFHRELYHPSTGLFFLYGDIPTEEQFRFLAPVLNDFDRKEVHVPTPRQTRWTAPKIVEKQYAIGATEDLTAKTFLSLNWIVGDAIDPALSCDWDVLSKVLLGNEAAPLKKALIDSKLGADVAFAGAWGPAYEQEFHIGLKGSEPDRAEAFEKMVLSTLEQLASEPFSAERVEAAFQQLSYETLEVNTQFPLHLLHASNASWPFNGDPLNFLKAKEQLDACHARYVADPTRFNRMIRDGLVNNQHRLRVVLRPDREIQSKADAAFAAKMAERRAKLSETEIAEIARSAAALSAAQGVPNSPEALAKLPQLKTSDLPAKPRRIPTQISKIGGVTVLRNDVFANGVNYFDIDMDLAGMPVDLYSWLTRYGDAIFKMGAKGQSFTTIAQRRSSCTGGISVGASMFIHSTEPSRTMRRFRFGMKTLDGQANKALNLLGDLIFGVDPRDRDRLRDVIIQSRASCRSALVNDGLGTAWRQAGRGLNPIGALDYRMSSPASLAELEVLAEHFDEHADRIMENIERVRDFVAGHTRWTVSFTGSDSVFDELTRTLDSWDLSRLCEILPDELPAFSPYATPPREGLAGPMKVAHCVKMMPAPHLAHADVPLFRLAVYLTRFDLLLPEIRFKGNAYGAGIEHDDTDGTLTLYSFRDPNIVETFDVFDRLREFVSTQNWSQTDIDRAIIGSAKAAEAPIRPGSATGAALSRFIRGDTDENRDARYAATLRATPQSVKETFLRVLDANESKSAYCVVSSREKLNLANEKLGEKKLTVTDILK